MTTTGERVGVHAGIAGYTIGQRAGLPSHNDGARYVTRIDTRTNTLVVGREDELFARTSTATPSISFAPKPSHAAKRRLLAMVRYRARAGPRPRCRRAGRHARTSLSTSRSARSHPASLSRCSRSTATKCSAPPPSPPQRNARCHPERSVRRTRSRRTALLRSPSTTALRASAQDDRASATSLRRFQYVSRMTGVKPAPTMSSSSRWRVASFVEPASCTTCSSKIVPPMSSQP